MNRHRLWAGVVMVLAATGFQIYAGGGWSIAMIAGLGALLLLTSFAEGKRI